MNHIAVTGMGCCSGAGHNIIETIDSLEQKRINCHQVPHSLFTTDLPCPAFVADSNAFEPMLIVGDICAVSIFHQHARWSYVRRMLPPACLGVVIAAIAMRWLNEAVYRPIIGVIILSLTVLQVMRSIRPEWFSHVPHTTWFTWTIGLIAGAATMSLGPPRPTIGPPP